MTTFLMRCFAFLLESSSIEFNNQYCLCVVPTGDGEYRRIGVCSWYLGRVYVAVNGIGMLRVDVGVNGIGTLQTLTIVAYYHFSFR